MPHAPRTPLYGKPVLVTGNLETRTLRGWVPHFDQQIKVIVVSKLKAAESEFVRETVTVDIKGKPAKRILFISFVPDPYLGVRWEVTSNGTTHVLDVGRNEHFWETASRLTGQTVVVTGVLKDGRMSVTTMQAAGEKLAMSRRSGDSTFRPVKAKLAGGGSGRYHGAYCPPFMTALPRRAGSLEQSMAQPEADQSAEDQSASRGVAGQDRSSDGRRKQPMPEAQGGRGSSGHPE